MMTRQTLLEQKRAKNAWEVVKTAKMKFLRDGEETNKQNKTHQKSFRSASRSGPADIQINGLGQTLAFWYARKESDAHYHDLYYAASEWVQGQIQGFGDGDILEWITTVAETKGYRRATQETIAYLNWVKRFAEAELEGE